MLFKFRVSFKEVILLLIQEVKECNGAKSKVSQ